MRKLSSYVLGKWSECEGSEYTLMNPTTEEAIAELSTKGLDFSACLDFARSKGCEALASMTLGQRAEMLAAMSKALQEHRDELIALSVENSGTTRRDSKFDIDGATGTLHYYSTLARGVEDRHYLVDGDGIQLGRTARTWGQHIWLAKKGAAVCINAFNFPAWGFAEKAACALLAGMPIIVKPASSTALVTERCFQIIAEAGVCPDGALQLICGSVGDLLDHMESQDVLSFTGSADTALKLRSHKNILAKSIPVNAEADSLNSIVIAPDVEDGSETLSLFYRDIFREITQKSGQKCTAIRRIFVPEERMDEIQAELIDRLTQASVGAAADENTRLGPLSTEQQLDAAVQGVKTLCEEAKIVYGTGQRVDGDGAPAGKGYFFGPTVLRCENPKEAKIVHAHEVFGPVVTLMPYDGSAKEAAGLVSKGDGMLVTAMYCSDRKFVGEFIAEGGSYCGRLYLGSEKGAEQAPGSGAAFPQLQHGGPGRAGGGSELGAMRGLQFYCQRVALQGDRGMLDRIVGLK